LEGKTILLHSEQGLGDTLQFSRYTRAVAALGANVLLEVQAPLEQLLGNLEGVAQALPYGSLLPAFDYQCPLLSLPLAFKTDLQSIPAILPYIRSDPAQVAARRERLGIRTKPRVGLVWSGNTAQRNDRHRSMALADLLPLVGDWVDWICLQKEMRESDVALASHPDIRQVSGELKTLPILRRSLNSWSSADGRRQRCAFGGRHGQGRVGAHLLFPRLAVALGSRGQPVVSDGAPVSANRNRRLSRVIARLHEELRGQFGARPH